MWGWLSLLLAIYVEANSNGVNIACDVDNPNLGNPARARSNYSMWWVLPPVFAGNQYTLRTADTASTASDPTTYTPGQWLTLYVRTTSQDQQFTGIMLYALNSQKAKVGAWEVPAGAPFHVSATENCVLHSNADPKNYLSVFKFQGPPAGTGTITIKGLVKFGLAFPSLTGTFFWPNNAHITLTEKPATAARIWYEGEVGESCIDVCLKQNLGCDLATMQAQGNSSDLLAKVQSFSNCTATVMPGCSAASPSVGQAGCFYHSDACIQPAAQPVWTRNDPCQGLPKYAAGTTYCTNNNDTCLVYNNSKWCCAYYTNSQPGTGDMQYGVWANNPKGACMPAGGWPANIASVPIPARVIAPRSSITCEAKKASVLDGQRICACSQDGTRVPNNSLTPTIGPSVSPTISPPPTTPLIDSSASQAALSLVAILISFVF